MSTGSGHQIISQSLNGPGKRSLSVILSDLQEVILLSEMQL